MKVFLPGLCLSTILLICSSAQADPQSTIAYQGLLADNSGTAVTGVRDVSVALFSEVAGGTVLWSETHDDVAINEGLFNLHLGAVEDITGVDFSHRLYLQITVADSDGGNPETLAARVPLSAVPFAMVARSVVGGINDADADAANELVTGVSLDGTTLMINQPGGAKTVDLSPLGDALGDDDDWTVDDDAVYRDDSTRALLFGDRQVPYNQERLIPLGGLMCNTKFFFYPDKAAIGGGGIRSVSGASQKAIWDYANLGNYSFSWGFECSASGSHATVSGGASNSAGGDQSTIAGGDSNRANSTYATVGGGRGNLADQYASVVAGGDQNTAEKFYSTVGGGSLNQARADYATISGGGPSNGNDPTNTRNVVYDDYGVIGGGGGNTAGSNDSNQTSATYTTIAGGKENLASDAFTTIGGGLLNKATVDYATVGGGVGNQASQDSATVGGGNGNQATNYHATVGGGIGNTATGHTSTVAGGYVCNATGHTSTIAGGNWNTAAGDQAFVGGGSTNQAAGDSSTVPGGLQNEAVGRLTTVSGGASNKAIGDRSVIAGGDNNQTSQVYASIGGGYYNSGDGEYATVAGGWNNNAYGNFSTIAGGGPSDTKNVLTTSNNVFDDYGAIGGGGDNQAGSDDGDAATATFSTVGGGVSNRAAAFATVIAGGSGNLTEGEYSAVCGGRNNQALGTYSTVGGGGPSDPDNPDTTQNIAYDDHCTIGGGGQNRAGDSDVITTTAPFASVLGGWGNLSSGTSCAVGRGDLNRASGIAAVVAGGSWNVSSANGSAIGGGNSNSASGEFSVVPGGQDNDASGDFSFACGFRADAAHDGAFVWADSTDRIERFASDRTDQFKVKAAGGALFVLDSVGGGRPVPAFRVQNDGDGPSFSILTGGTQTLEARQNGDLAVSGKVLATNIISPSDTRLKKDVRTLTGVLDKLHAVRGVNFSFTDTEHYPAASQIGVIAQELQAVYPQLVHQNGDGMLGVDYAKLSAILLQAIKEQQAEIETLKGETDQRLRAIEAKLGL